MQEAIQSTSTDEPQAIIIADEPVSTEIKVSPYAKKISEFLNTEKGAEAKRRLELMHADALYRTPATYTSNINQYPDNILPFVDKHILYLSTHPQLGAEVYIDNLQLMSRIRS